MASICKLTASSSTIRMCERLVTREFISVATISCSYFEKWAAVKIEERRQFIHPDEEDSYFTLMKLYEALNNTIAVEKQS
ncbi:hypothetical protein [Lysinibacillus parviboronicapiens]|uniref:hypothetical protein n=1 Tax=Lysinibacillus parviboronicapiens TaxID=436516 RepID=UPI00142E5E16|nr:hypothetical protein [Lysinibacillus parviboronicapiens]